MYHWRYTLSLCLHYHRSSLSLFFLVIHSSLPSFFSDPFSSWSLFSSLVTRTSFSLFLPCHNQSLFFLLNVACLKETNLIVFGLTSPGYDTNFHTHTGRPGMYCMDDMDSVHRLSPKNNHRHFPPPHKSQLRPNKLNEYTMHQVTHTPYAKTNKSNLSNEKPM